MPIYLGSTEIKRVNTTISSSDGGINTDDATLTDSNQLLANVTAYSKGKKYTGTIPTKTASNLTAANNVVYVPSGYYASACSKEIATQELPIPTVSVGNDGLITASSTLSSSGYVSAGTKQGTAQLDVQAAATVVPTSSEQTAVAARKYTTGAVKVAAVPTETKTVTANGTYTPSDGKYFSSVEVAVAGDTPTYQQKTISPSQDEQTVTPDDGYDALSQVTIEAAKLQDKTVSAGTEQQTYSADTGYYGLAYVTVKGINIEKKTISDNGTYTPTAGSWFSEVTVNVEPSLQSKSVSPSETVQVIKADSSYDGLSQVSVGAIQTETKSISSNGTYNPTAGKYFSSVTVSVAGEDYKTQEKTATPTEAEQTITPDVGYDGLSKVTVGAATLQDKTVTPTTSKQTVSADSGYYGLGSVDVGAISTETKTVTANGTYNPTSGKYFSSVTVNVPSDTFTTQTKTVAPSTSEQTVTPDTGYNGLSKVTVSAIKNQSKTVSPKTTAQTVSPDSGYNGLSSVTINAATLQSKTVSPSTTSQSISADSGYYGLSEVTVSAMKLAGLAGITPTTSKQSYSASDDGYDGYSTVSIEAIKTETKDITANGTYTPTNGSYFSGVTVNVDTTPNLQSKSVTPSESSQTVKADSSYDGLSSVTVGAISSTYIGSGITQKGAATYTPTTSSQTIAAGQYLSGAQTIAGDSDLVASNIKSGVSIFNVTGTYTSDATAVASNIESGKTAYVSGAKITGTMEIQSYYSGTTAPTSSIGVDGDIYFMTE